MSNKDKCLDEITKPSTDNSEMACDKYTDACCVLVGTDYPFLSIKAGDNLETVFAVLMTTVKKQQQTIDNLTEYIQNL